jgi:hypothetical protein
MKSIRIERGGSGGRRPPARGVWGAGAPQIKAGGLGGGSPPGGLLNTLKVPSQTTTPWCAAAVITTRSTFKIEDPSLGPGRVDFRAPDEGFGLEGTPKPKI